MTNVLRSKIEKRLRECKGIGSQKGRGAKPPDLWRSGSPRNATKLSQTYLPKVQTLSRNLAFLNPLAACNPIFLLTIVVEHEAHCEFHGAAFTLRGLEVA